MPAFRKDLTSIGAYKPGKPIDEVMREYGVSDIVKLASNECPEPPFSPVQKVIAEAARDINRYPDTAAHDLTRAIAAHHRVAPEEVWVGAGSTSILASIAQAMGSEGTSAVFSKNSFVLYTIVSAMARMTPIAVPLDSAMRLDPAAMASAVRPDTTVLYFCNPNNPTGTYVAPSGIGVLIEAVPEEVLIVIDEAYEEYVTHPDHASAIHHALRRPNVVVTRTFSKIYGLAGLRVGYAIGRAATIEALRRLQLPFATTSVSQAAAREALRHQDLVAARVKENARGRDQVTSGLDLLGISYLDSQTNFILMRPSETPDALCDALLRRGVVVRQFGEYIRVTIGTEAENTRFLQTLRELL